MLRVAFASGHFKKLNVAGIPHFNLWPKRLRDEYGNFTDA
jgi:hypothetical protein